jgi:hypothetical protein
MFVVASFYFKWKIIEKRHRTLDLCVHRMGSSSGYVMNTIPRGQYCKRKKSFFSSTKAQNTFPHTYLTDDIINLQTQYSWKFILQKKHCNIDVEIKGIDSSRKTRIL